LKCESDAMPRPTYTWERVGRNLTGVPNGVASNLMLTSLDMDSDAGDYNCTASNTVSGTNYSVTFTYTLSITETTTTVTTTPSTTEATSQGNTAGASLGGGNDNETIIIVVCAVVGVLLIIAVVVGIVWYRKRSPRKEIEEPSEKPYKPNLSFQNPQPDLVADEKKFNNPSLNNSFDYKNEDGLMYADLTYDNRPRSRKPMALGDTASEYSDVQMPSV
jgi:hypothetical protein